MIRCGVAERRPSTILEQFGAESQAVAVVDEDALVVKELSKFELQCREKAQQRQKDRLATGTPQSVAGKTLKSSAFVSEPSTIEYIDFTPGQRHVLNIKLTNGSLTFNNFKLLPLADEVTDFFEITYTKPGRMSAGTSCMLEIAFTPQVNEDIFAELPMLAATGPSVCFQDVHEEGRAFYKS